MDFGSFCFLTPLKLTATASVTILPWSETGTVKATATETSDSDVAAYASSAARAFYINLLLKKINTNAKAAKAAYKAEGK